MTPSLSRRVGRVMNTEVVLSLSLVDRKSFRKRISSKEVFSDLLKQDQKLILSAEGELEG